jgi:hypothetical protein
MSEDWRSDLETALFTRLPAHEPDWTYEGSQYVAERALEDVRGQLYFVETWSDRRTHKVAGSWRLALEAGAFVGVPDWLLQRSVDTLVQAIARERPKPKTRSEPETFNPGRFAAQEGRRRG